MRNTAIFMAEKNDNNNYSGENIEFFFLISARNIDCGALVR